MNKTEILQKIIADKKADALFLGPSHPNHKWLLGKKMEGSFIIIPKTGKATVFKSPLEKINTDKFKIVEIKSKKQIETEIKKIKIKRLCADYTKFTLSNKKLFKGSKTINIYNEISATREIKSPEEIKKMSHANKLTAECFNDLIKIWKKKKFSHEKEVINYIKEYGAKKGFEQAFEPLVASGINATVPHHTDSTPLKKGFCIIDFGFDCEGYKADMTRTIYLGKPTEKEKETYQKILNIQTDLLSMCLPGTSVSELDSASRKMLGEESKYFIHSLGHGAGIEIHESPGMGHATKEQLKEGMIITIEPGIYDKKRKLGIRIEDSLLIRKGIPKILTKKATKKLVIINKNI